MDRQAGEDLEGRGSAAGPEPGLARPTTRRQVLKQAAIAAVGLSAAGAGAWYLLRRPRFLPATDIFPGDAPQGELWELWQQQGWFKEAKYYLKLGRNIQCKLCPNECLLAPEDRSHCRTRVNKDGTLYTLGYGNPCAFHVDPIEKKPLFHFLPGAKAFSIAVAGCVYRCLNCQNWDISQKRPDETKKPDGQPIRLNPGNLDSLATMDPERLSMFPEDVVALAEYAKSETIAYTYSEPTAWYEYMLDTAALARQKQIKNLWITCGSMQREPLLELCKVLDAANVDLKSFSEQIYRKLNSGRLQPVLDTLVTLKQQGIWLEVTNLIVPTYTDDLEMIRRMCDWLVENLGPDYPLHFSRFHPKHKLRHLPETPIEVLQEARRIARQIGLHYVYIGNVPGLREAETTFCPGCGGAVIQRDGFFVDAINLKQGRCGFCGRAIAGVWSGT